MMADLNGKVVLVTGASTGIGAAVARAFGTNCACVVVHYHASEAAARDVVAAVKAAGGDAIALRADARVPAELVRLVDDAAAHFGGLDVLINNAGDLLGRRPVADGDDALLQQLYELNMRSVVVASRAAIPHLRRRRRGCIINTTSIAARHGGGPGSVLYAASKGFVSTFTRGLAKELAPDGIRVNAVAPGVITTPLQQRYTTAAQLEAFRAAVPMGRLGVADECAGAYLYLASEDLASYVTGQVLEVNGGQLMP